VHLKINTTGEHILYGEHILHLDGFEQLVHLEEVHGAAALAVLHACTSVFENVEHGLISRGLARVRVKRDLPCVKRDLLWK